MLPAQLIGQAASLSLLAGWRLYATVLAAGLAMRFGWIDAPAHTGLGVLASYPVLGVAAVGTLAEFLADKIAWVDSIWDSVHTIIRPLGGALIAAAVIDPNDPATQIATLLLGGSAALLTHTAKASTRALINTSPEPFSNIAVSAVEDTATTGLLVLVLAHPWLGGGIALALVFTAALIIRAAWRGLHRVRLWWRRTRADVRARVGGR
jgi:hypothetical protein